MVSGLHLLLSYRCTHSCDHCFVHSSPAARGSFTLRQLRQLLDQAVELGSVEWIFFEGGEPFLYHPLLVEGVRAARERGFSVGMVSNAYWAESAEDAELWLKPLADIGVQNMTFSVGAFHGAEEEGPVRHARVAAERLGLPEGVLCIEHPDLANDVRFKGRAAEQLTAGRPRQPWTSFSACDDEDLASPERVHIDCYGHVHLCQGLSMGNLWERPLAQLAASWDPAAHPICGPLLTGGPAQLARAYGLQPDEGYVSACHLCYRLRQVLRERLPQWLAPAQVYGVE